MALRKQGTFWRWLTRLQGDFTGSAGAGTMIRVALRLALLAVLLLAGRASSAHEVRPAFLDLSETTQSLFLMTWKVPALGEFRLEHHAATTARMPCRRRTDLDAGRRRLY